MLICTGVCFGAAVTSSPYDGTGWNTSAPNDEALVGNTYKETQDLRKGVGIRYDKEHIDAASSSVGGEHSQGSARMFYLATASIPALQPDGTALVAADNGMLWHDITTDYIYALDDYSDPTVDGGWLSIGTLLGDVDVGASKFTVAAATGNTVVVGTLGVTGASTFTAGITCNGGVTLGAGDDLIGSATSDVNMGGNFLVAGATGNTTVGGTLGVTGAATFTAGITANGGVTLGAGDDLIGSATSDITINTDKFTVAGDTGNTVVDGTLDVAGASNLAGGILGVYAADDDDTAAMVDGHAYLANQDGFVTAIQTGGSAGDTIKGYIDTDSDPASGGDLIAEQPISHTTGTSIHFAVPSGKYFEIVVSTGAATIWWQPVGTLVKCTDQEAP